MENTYEIELDDDTDDSGVGSNECIRTRNSNINIESLVSKIRRGIFNLSPSWQREPVWKISQKSALIESILIGMPIPSIFMFDSENGTYDIIDGKQRLTAIMEFATGVFVLEKLTIRSELNGMSYLQLPTLERDRFENYDVNVNVIESNNHQLKFRMFERLNTGGTALNAQEVRNCVYRGRLNDTIRKLTQDETFTKLMNRNAPDSRMDNESYIFGFAAFRDAIILGGTQWATGLKTLINSFCDKNKNISDFDLKSLEDDFKFSCRATDVVFGPLSFRKFNEEDNANVKYNPKNKRNIVIFRVQLLAFVKYRKMKLFEIQARADEIRIAFLELLSNEVFVALINGSSGNFEKNRQALQLWQNALDSVIQEPLSLPFPFIESVERINFPPNLKQELFDKSVDKLCPVCGNQMIELSNLQIDHIIPISKGGKNEIENLQLLHTACNNKKRGIVVITQ